MRCGFTYGYGCLSSAQFSSGAAAATAVVVAVVAVVAVVLLLPLLSKVGTLGKNIINTFDLLTGEWLWWKLHWNCAREQAEPEEKRRSKRKNNKKVQPEQPHFMA